MIYQWKEAAHVHIDPQAAGEEMERLRTLYNGRLESQMLVEAARSADSPLHDHFEWDDTRAAAAHRDNQARHLIRSITVEIEKWDGGTAPMRAGTSLEFIFKA